MIVTVQVTLYFEPAGRSNEDLYRLVADAVADLAPLHPRMSNWHILPASAKEKATPLAERERAIAAMNAQIERYKREFGDFDGYGASLDVANVDNNRDWRKPGVVSVGASLAAGQFSVTLKGVEPFGAELAGIVQGILVALAPRLDAKFANTDVKSRTPEKGLVSYQFDLRLYQHRQFFSWMGYVPVEIPHERIRDAHVTVKAGKGTVIVAVPGLFDPADDAQVYKAHRVEMDLASYDLLPVIDPNLKK
ncbi:hypothetical protein QFW77_02735 [Luteimonas sp. RD2P54]|uniref:Immunity protein 52 domain-containing protein n=1 Tax=Luteimonas endophytica TaxID=3042023 RepID=A0ABT6J507_9GAMM|nr:hypothetical protein [Luteimonas endophytica]MDH5821911.1 hypothetical protein [Luteimonas endophytica]